MLQIPAVVYKNDRDEVERSIVLGLQRVFFDLQTESSPVTRVRVVGLCLDL